MRFIAAVSLTALALAGCNKGVNETNASVEEVAEAVSKSGSGVTLKPGRWETTSELLELSAPDMPPQAQEMMKRQMAANSNKIAVCLKPEDVAKPNAGFFGQTSKECIFDHYRMSGGKVDAKMSCGAPGGGQKMTMTMAGTYSSDRYDMEMATAMIANGDRPMSMRMKMVSTRTGECTGNEVSASPKA